MKNTMNTTMITIVIVVVLLVIVGNILLLRKQTGFKFDKEKFERNKAKAKKFDDENDDW